MRRLRERSGAFASGCLASLLGATLLLGVVEVHGPAEEHSALDRPGVVFTGARHAAQPAHFETSEEAAVPRCAWCVVHLQGLGSALEEPAQLARPVDARHAAADLPTQPACAPRQPPVSRGPPAA